jgi:Na+-translocating ferredoxin:NAD+ oxidoreductase RnfE subunit
MRQRTEAAACRAAGGDFKSDRIKRVMDGLTFGMGMTLALLLIWAIRKISPIPVMEAMDGFSIAAMILGVFAVTFAFVIGYLVIAPIRENSSLRHADREMMSGAALMGV